MKTVGIVTENWKVDIFENHLDKHGFEYTVIEGPMKDCATLKVTTRSVAELQPVVQAAVNEAKQKGVS